MNNNVARSLFSRCSMACTGVSFIGLPVMSGAIGIAGL